MRISAILAHEIWATEPMRGQIGKPRDMHEAEATRSDAAPDDWARHLSGPVRRRTQPRENPYTGQSQRSESSEENGSRRCLGFRHCTVRPVAERGLTRFMSAASETSDILRMGRSHTPGRLGSAAPNIPDEPD